MDYHRARRIFKAYFFLIFISPFLSACIPLFWFRKKYSQNEKILIAPLLVMGIWILGPLGCMTDGSVSGGGFTTMKSLDDYKEFFLMILVFPVSTISGSTYAGTLGALLIFTLLSIALVLFDGYKILAKRNSSKLSESK